MGGDDLRDDGDAAFRLAQAVASRICHDLVSPVGAVVNGIDLVREMGGAGGPEETEMIGASASRAGALLEWQRLAFGAGSGEGAAIARGRLAEMADQVIASKRVSVAVAPAAGPALARPAARLAALMLLAGRGLLGMRGALALDLGAEDAWPMRLGVAGEGATAAAEIEARLARNAAEPEARTVEFALLHPAARSAGARLAVAAGAQGPVLEARAAG